MSTIRLALTIASDHVAFAGHFPGMPIVPGVVLLDEALHAIGQSVGTDLSACRINSVKFFNPVRPGEAVEVEYDMTGSQAIRFTVFGGGVKAAQGSIRVAAAER
jgi:3-hydroxyacyl-[acyl-carrier-protein] dehydratase